ncbi:MSCRAMM family protein [Listeria innocua]|uniref:MSCRAMM family protein n=1 Tax=Listeria innocua TaxID=1642 RepID=UPI0017AB66F0|nr:SpaA isopeptide-forming pilin-related protein [Listeria innocua]UPH48379.1 Ig-like domain-containing protein [Listeria innocua]
MKLKRGLKLVTILTLIFTMVVPFFQSGTKARAAELNNVIDSVTVTHNDGSSTGNYDFYEEITSNFKWSAKTNNLKSGDTFTVKLGKTIYVADSITFPLKTEDDQVAGEVVVDAANNIMTVTFNSYVEGRANVKGTIQLQDYFNLETIKEETVVPLTYTFNGETTTINVNVNPTPVVNPEEILIKGGTISQDETNIINWNARINFANKTINNAVIVDTLGPGHEFVENSIVLTKQAYNEYGVMVPPSSIVPSSDYTVTFDSPTKMKISLGDINQSYRLTYQTKITDSSLQRYKNTIAISGENIETKSLDVVSDSTSGSGTADGDYGSFEVTKVDKNDHNITLEGAEFTLVSDTTGTSYQLTTNVSGKANLDNLPLGDYTLTETKAPVGYEISNSPVKITINSSIQTSFMFENEKMPPAKGTLEITKVDSQDTSLQLAGAEFKLVDMDGNIITRIVTDASGKANLNNLTPGEYQLIETKAPTGYKLDETPISLTIKAEEVTKIAVENTRTPLTPLTPPIPAPPTPLPNTPIPIKPNIKTDIGKKVTVNERNVEKTKNLPKTGDTQKTVIFILLGTILLIVAYPVIKAKKVN